MSKKHQKACSALNYIQHLLILAFAATGCVSISTFASLVGIPIGIASSAGTKKYKSIIKNKKKKHDKISLLAKTKLNVIEVVIYRVLIDSYTSVKKIL